MVFKKDTVVAGTMFSGFVFQFLMGAKRNGL